VTLLYGPDLANAARPLAVLAWVIPLMFLSEFLGYVAIIVGRETLAARANWVASGSNVALNLALIPLFGVTAAALVTVLTEIVLVVQYFGSLRGVGLLAQLRDTYGRTLLVVGALLVVMVAASQLRDVPVLPLGCAAVVFYFGAAALCGAVGRDEWRYARAAFGKSPQVRAERSDAG
jgi:O-antigen/teichoic acid export membrane protein